MANDRLHEDAQETALANQCGYTDQHSGHIFNEDAHAREDETEIRYALTALGSRALAEGQGFSGFGPCAGPAWRTEMPATSRPRREPRGRRQRAMPLFD